MSITRSATLVLAGLALLVRSVPTAAQAAPPLAGRWQYLQPSDKEGEVLDLVVASGEWRGIMNGLLRAGEDGLYYYVVEIENVQVGPEGTIRFEIGERLLFSKRPGCPCWAARQTPALAGIACCLPDGSRPAISCCGAST